MKKIYNTPATRVCDFGTDAILETLPIVESVIATDGSGDDDEYNEDGSGLAKEFQDFGFDKWTLE